MNILLSLLLNENLALYFFSFLAAFILSLILTPAARSAAFIFDIHDHPITAVKTHKEPVPYLGGAAIFLSFVFSLLWIRVLTSFPTGTLKALRGILLGGTITFVLGVIDDIKPHGLHYRTKFVFQFLACAALIQFGIHIKFVQPLWLGYVFTLLWIIGVTNAFNLIDIMDGLASGVAFVSAMAFLLISLPTEEVYVNFAAAALAGAVLGFLPYNLSKKYRIFMGDSGSLFIGFVASSLAMGTSYSGKTQIGVFSPILILAVPIFDTALVFYLRLRRGMSPFLGSKDHYALRMERLGWTRPKILLFSMAFAAVMGAAAFIITQVPFREALIVYGICAAALAAFTRYIMKAGNPS